MNEQLQEQLTILVSKSANAIGTGLDFLSSEIPVVLQQLLMWKLIWASITTLVCTVVILSLIYLWCMCSGLGADKGDGHYKWTLTHGYNGYVSPHVMFTVTMSIILLMFCMIGMCMNFKTVLQIWIAPKVYLIEYAASLIK